MSVVQVAAKGNKVRQENADRISTLPSVVTQNILEHLPLKDAARMSILSKHWRYRWLLLPKLVLDEDFYFEMGLKLDTSADVQSTYRNIVNNFLEHMGPISLIDLYIPGWCVYADVTHWIQLVSVKGVKKLSLREGRISERLPSCVFSCTGLTYLGLCNFSINSIPPTFGGFPRLTSLNLYNIRNSQEASMLETLLSSCPQLESLKLYFYFDTVGEDISVTISAPNLDYLSVGGYVKNVHLKGTTKIGILSLKAWWQMEKQLSKFFCSVPNLWKLELENSFWADLADCSKDAPKIAIKFEQLTTLKLVNIPVNCHWAISLALGLFRSSPNLENLEITDPANCERCGDKLLQIKKDCSLKNLENVAFAGISCSNHDLQLIKLLLFCSPVLKVMTIKFKGDMRQQPEEKLNIVTDLKGCPRASTNAKIIFKSYYKPHQNIPVVSLDSRRILYEKAIA